MDNAAFVDLDSEIEKPKNISGLPPDKVYSFEEAATLAGTGKYHYFLLLLCGLCFMTAMVETSFISVILPFLKCDLRSTIAEQGFLASSGFFGIVVSSHAMGFLADTWGRVKILRTGLLFSFITTLLSAFSTNIWMLIVLRFLNGLAVSGCQASVFSFCGEFHGHMTRTRYVTVLSVFLPIGLTYLPGMALVILPLQIDVHAVGFILTPWRLYILMNSSLSLICLSGLFLLPESPKYNLIQGNVENALQTFRKMFKWNTGRPENEYPVKQMHIEISGSKLNTVHGIKSALSLIWNQTAPLFARTRILHTINICGVMFVIAASSQGFYMWLPTILTQIVENSESGYLVCEIMEMAGTVSKNSTIIVDQCGRPVNTEMFQILILLGGFFTLNYLVITFSINIIGKKNLLIIYLSIGSICCLLLHFLNSYVLSIILMTLTLTTGGGMGIVNGISTEYFPTNINAMAMCLITMASRLGAVFGSNFIGLEIFTNCNKLFYVYVGMLAFCALCSVFLPKSVKRKENNQIVVKSS